MKARLLKKLRKRAYNEIGMLYFVDNIGQNTYNIGFRTRLTTDYGCSGYVERTLEYAKEKGTLGLDYNQIYDAVKHGYHQAEKDKKLTWKDMREIHCITLNLRQHLGASVFGEPLYQEVLKRFKERKEK